MSHLHAVAARIDPNPLVTGWTWTLPSPRIDIVGIAREVIAAIDLPEIVRDSTARCPPTRCAPSGPKGCRPTRWWRASSTACCAAAGERNRWCREHRAQSLRGRAAGIVTRLLAATIDLLTVLLMMGGVFVGVAPWGFLVSPLSFRWPTPSSSLSTVIVVLLAVGYLPMGWATVGRTGGAAVLGLRVLSAGRSRPGWARAGLRAMLCVVFPSACCGRRSAASAARCRTSWSARWSSTTGTGRPPRSTDSAQRPARWHPGRGRSARPPHPARGMPISAEERTVPSGEGCGDIGTKARWTR